MKRNGGISKLAALLVALVVIFILSAVYLGYLLLKPQSKFSTIPTTVINPNDASGALVATPLEFPNGMPLVSQPQVDEKVTSPLVIKGTVPAGWMSEGVFPIIVYDLNNKILAKGQATEDTPGTWQSGKPVNFTATITFTTDAPNGTVVLLNDNPSGDPNNEKGLTVPVTFQ